MAKWTLTLIIGLFVFGLTFFIGYLFLGIELLIVAGFAVVLATMVANKVKE